MTTTTASAFAFNGADHAYDVTGDGSPIVFVHAGIADRRMWGPQLDLLAGKYQVVRLDMRGFGETPISGDPFSFREDIVALMDHLGIERAHLVGCSMGGAACIELALAHPGRLASLTLVCAAVNGIDHEDEDARKADEAIEAAYEAGDLDTAVDGTVQMWVAGPSRRLNELPSDVLELTRDMVRRSFELRREHDTYGDWLERPSAAERLHEIAVPVLIVTGEHDQPGIAATWDQVGGRLRASERHDLSGVAHLPNLERPDLFNPVLERFLDRVDST